MKKTSSETIKQVVSVKDGRGNFLYWSDKKGYVYFKDLEPELQKLVEAEAESININTIGTAYKEEEENKNDSTL